MQQVAVGWLVYRLTHSVFLLGVVGFASQIPTLFIAPIAGVIVDRWNKYRIMVLTQILAMLQALLMAILLWMNLITVEWILFLCVVLGVITAFDIPSRQSFFVEMVDKKEDIGNLIAINASMFNGARLIGPSIAGIVIAFSGELPCFFINAISYIPAITALLWMRFRLNPASPTKESLLADMKQGFSYAYRFAPVRYVLLTLSLASLFGMSFTVLMPAFAKEILKGGPDTLGFLIGATGFGAFAGGIYMASRRSVIGLGKRLIHGLILFGLSLVAFSLSRHLMVSLVLMFLAGAGMMIHMTSCNTILQTVADDDKRGRVMSFYTMAFMGMAPFGSLAIGYFASKIGPAVAVFFGGWVCFIVAIIFLAKYQSFRQILREVYIKKGIVS